MNECVRPHGTIWLVSKKNLSPMLMLMLIFPCSQLGCKFAFYIKRLLRVYSLGMLVGTHNRLILDKKKFECATCNVFFDLLHRYTTQVTTQSSYTNILHNSVVMKGGTKCMNK
jgi:hypothetical protein